MKIRFLVLIMQLLGQYTLAHCQEFNLSNINITYGTYLENAYMMIRDNDTEEIYNEMIFDEGFNESFIYLAVVSEDQFILMMEKQNISSGEQSYSLLLFNIYGELLNRKDIDTKPENFYNHHYLLILSNDGDRVYIDKDLEVHDDYHFKSQKDNIYQIQYQGQAYINEEAVEKILIDEPGIYHIEIVMGEYKYSEDFTLEADIEIIGESYKDGYKGSVKVISNGQLVLNGNDYRSGQVINQIGEIKLELHGVNHYYQTIDFKIYPWIHYFDGYDHFDLKDGMVFDYPISIYSNIGSIISNDCLYDGNFISETGAYLLEFQENGHIIETLNISITSRVDGVINNEVYKQVNLYAFGDVWLNGQPITGTNLIKQPGTYHLKIKNMDDTYKEMIFFILEETSQEKKSILPYGLLVISVVGVIITLTKK
ncbi:hypothetical protein KHQ88_00510 [Mycoplasmatota bacterium]|nr:hypothetical protein KHQ88_00510 [Mycoplasmatota bacterium]